MSGGRQENEWGAAGGGWRRQVGLQGSGFREGCAPRKRVRVTPLCRRTGRGLGIRSLDQGREHCWAQQGAEGGPPSGSQAAGRGGVASLSSGARLTRYRVCAIWGGRDSVGLSVDPKPGHVHFQGE